VPQHAGPVESDEVGTIPAFDLPGGGGKRRDPPDPPSSPPLRTLAPILFQLLTGLGMLPEARARLGITLVEEPEPIVPRPARLPRAAR
jgi:hypothetical protein